MAIRQSARLLLVATALVACSSEVTGPGTDLPDAPPEDGLSLAIVSPSVQAGREVAFRFVNQGSDTVTTGFLDCVNFYEQAVGAEWRAIHPLRQCIAIAQMHLPGGSSDHATPAPEHAGRYRLVVAVYRDDGGAVGVRSAPFVVE